MAMEREERRRRIDARVRNEGILHSFALAAGELGVVGELGNALLLVLAIVTRALPDPVSILIKGSSSSGKSSLAKRMLMLCPPEWLITLTSLTAKAPVYSAESMEGKVFYLVEYRGGKEAQYLTRIQQSEGTIQHEYTTNRGAERGTVTATRHGRPVVITTTTAEKVFEDDETRFMSIWVDESPTQTLAIAKACLNPEDGPSPRQLQLWHAVLRRICRDIPHIQFPGWFAAVAEGLPVQQVRVRRDWLRFLAFCKAIALARRFSNKEANSLLVTVDFSDYAIAYSLLNSVFTATTQGVPEQEAKLAKAVGDLVSKLDRPVALKEVSAHLDWNYELAYKHLKPAIEHKLIEYVGGSTRQGNVKLLRPVANTAKGFLPAPQLLLAQNPQIPECQYIDPLSGNVVTLTRRISAKAGAKARPIAS